MMENRKPLGKTEGDSALLFPVHTHASSPCVNELQVNGKNVQIWDYTQLECLTTPVLRQRMLGIIEALGADNCPPPPSNQAPDLIRWILHMQEEITGDNLQVNRTNAGIPRWLEQEDEWSPLKKKARTPQPPAPFGRKMTRASELDAARDHYWDMRHNQREYANDMVFGIESARVGGEGKRHLQPAKNMHCTGISTAPDLGIETQKEGGEGRRYIRPRDNINEQAEENEAFFRGQAELPTLPSPRRHMSENATFAGHGTREAMGTGRPDVVPGNVNLFDRKRHLECEDHMMYAGTADCESWERPGRKNQDAFSPNNSTRTRGEDPEYQASWRQNPSRLHGRSMK
jgi:hypothetical protein